MQAEIDPSNNSGVSLSTRTVLQALVQKLEKDLRRKFTEEVYLEQGK